MTITVLNSKGTPKREIARTLGVTDGTVRYHLRRKAAGATDGRKNKTSKARRFEEAIAAYYAAHGGDRPPNVDLLFAHLVENHGYEGSYKSVLRYVRRTRGAPRLRAFRRVETPPGAQSQVDWAEFPEVDVGDGPEPLSAFLMTLSHSRMTAVVWSRSKASTSWIACHNAAFIRLGGIAAVGRIDNVKTAISVGAGAFGTIHPAFRAYAASVGFHVDACPPREPNAKGKVEAKVRLLRLMSDVASRSYSDLAALQEETDAKIDAWSRTARCPITGTTVYEAWRAEIPKLRPLPLLLPEPFDVAVLRPVSRDCVVSFEDRKYAVPFRHVGTLVEVRGCATTVQIVADGAVVREFPRGTKSRLLLDPTCYEGEATDRVVPPPPLGRMGRRLQEILETPVERRPIDLYAALAGAAR